MTKFYAFLAGLAPRGLIVALVKRFLGEVLPTLPTAYRLSLQPVIDRVIADFEAGRVTVVKS